MPPKKKQAVGPVEVAAPAPSSKPPPQKNPEAQAEAPVPAVDPAKRKRTKTKVVVKEEPDVVKQDDTFSALLEPFYAGKRQARKSTL